MRNFPLPPLEEVIAGRLGSPQGRRGTWAGRPWWACPFHPDRNPSLTILPGGTGWHCFGCGLSGDAIPISARILCVADVYDALTTHRPYRAAFTPHDALEAMRADRGRVFDPDILDRFARILESLPAPIAFPPATPPDQSDTGPNPIAPPFAA